MYKNTAYDADLVAKWCPDANTPEVPPILVDTVVSIPLEGEPGRVVASGPADATVAGEADAADAYVEEAKQARYISAFDPDGIPGANHSSATLDVAALMTALEHVGTAAAAASESRYVADVK